MKRRIIMIGSMTLVCALALTACNKENAVEVPTGPVALSQGSSLDPPCCPESWNLKWTVRSVSGSCSNLSPGHSANYELAIGRTGNSITMIYDKRNYPTDSMEYTGSVTGTGLIAQSNFGLRCSGGGTRPFSAKLTGSFTPDGRILTAIETWTSSDGTGDQTVIDWVASKM